MDSERDGQLNGHYCEGYKRGRDAAKSKSNILKQYRNGRCMCEGWTDGFRTTGRRKNQAHYRSGYLRGRVDAAGNEEGMFIHALDEAAWREGWVDGYRGLDKRGPTTVNRQAESPGRRRKDLPD